MERLKSLARRGKRLIKTAVISAIIICPVTLVGAMIISSWLYQKRKTQAHMNLNTLEI